MIPAFLASAAGKLVGKVGLYVMAAAAIVAIVGGAWLYVQAKDRRIAAQAAEIATLSAQVDDMQRQRDAAAALADHNAQMAREVAGVYERQVEAIAADLEAERARKAKVRTVTREIVRNAAPVPPNCPAVPDAVMRALDFVRAERAHRPAD